jgi:hypothetical protein
VPLAECDAQWTIGKTFGSQARSGVSSHSGIGSAFGHPGWTYGLDLGPGRLMQRRIPRIATTNYPHYVLPFDTHTHGGTKRRVR